MNPALTPPLRPGRRTAERLLRLLTGLVLFSALGGPAGAVEGNLIDVVVHSPSLEGNFLGDSPDRDVTIYLPPGYDEHPDARYAVLYLLHGYTGSNRGWVDDARARITPILDDLIGTGTIEPMIVVMPDAHNRYGAMTLGMLHPEVFGAVYSLSGGLLAIVDPGQGWYSSTVGAQALRATTFDAQGIYTQILIAFAAVVTPNPENPPFYVDLPYELVDGEVRPVPVPPSPSSWPSRTRCL